MIGERTTVWLAFAIGGAVYQGAKGLLGFSADWHVVADAIYWTGGALFTHWFSYGRMAKYRRGAA